MCFPKKVHTNAICFIKITFTCLVLGTCTYMIGVQNAIFWINLLFWFELLIKRIYDDGGEKGENPELMDKEVEFLKVIERGWRAWYKKGVGGAVFMEYEGSLIREQRRERRKRLDPMGPTVKILMDFLFLYPALTKLTLFVNLKIKTKVHHLLIFTSYTCQYDFHLIQG